MTTENKPLWIEGMFMRPHHFQQHDRYLEAHIEGRVAGLRPHSWGISALEIDPQALGLGKLSLVRARAVMPDGTPVEVPSHGLAVAPRDIPTNFSNGRVFLALPVRAADGPEIDPDKDGRITPRFQAAERSLRNSTDRSSRELGIQVGVPNLRLVLEGEPAEDLVLLAIARVKERDADGSAVLDDQFLPPALDCGGHTGFGRFIGEISALLRRRGEALAAMVDPARADGVSALTDFLLLQLINRFEPLFDHFAATRPLHPESVYAAALQLAGELATFDGPRRPPAFPPYAHDGLDGCFLPLLQFIRQALSIVTERSAVQLPIEARKYGVYISIIADQSLLRSARFVLAVRASVDSADLMRSFPSQVKIGPVEEIRNLVNLQLPGIGLRALPVAPREIPYHSDTAYFELDKRSDLWSKLTGSASFAFHIAGEFPGIRLEFWAIRES
jgi:type VI secretion system protein ImpJ